MPVSLSNKLSIKDVDLKGKRVVMRSVPLVSVGWEQDSDLV